MVSHDDTKCEIVDVFVLTFKFEISSIKYNLISVIDVLLWFVLGINVLLVNIGMLTCLLVMIDLLHFYMHVKYKHKNYIKNFSML